jgi:uncharacterized protein (DUF58 family)
VRGSSTEFRDYREYSQGDDPARVDWRVFARNDRHVIRTYEQEAQTGCIVLLDLSASMDFGAPETKHRYAARMAASLCHLVVHSQDRAGLQTIGGGDHTWFPPAGNARHLAGMLQHLNQSAPQRTADIPEALRSLNGRVHTGSTLVMISDFYTSAADLFHALNPLLHKGFDVHMLHILDPAERQLPGERMVRFEDLETGGRLKSDPRGLRARYQALLENHIRGYRQLAVRRGVRHRVVFTDQPLLSALTDLTA